MSYSTLKINSWDHIATLSPCKCAHSHIRSYSNEQEFFDSHFQVLAKVIYYRSEYYSKCIPDTCTAHPTRVSDLEGPSAMLFTVR